MQKKELRKIAKEVIAMEHAEHTRMELEHQARRKKQWRKRLAVSVSTSALLIAGGVMLGQHLLLTGAELTVGAWAHWLFFGTAE